MLKLALPRTAVSIKLPAIPAVAIVLACALVLGAVLRLLWLYDIEYKFDERDFFEQAQYSAQQQTWPLLGPPSSAVIRPPGGSYWIFIVLTRLFGITSPIGLALACVMMNVIALVGFTFFAFRWVSASERPIWLWGLSIASVNPLLILLQRKIWNVSVTPLFLLVSLWGWWHRDRRSGAFVWGLVSVLIGQLHIAGLFCAAGFAGWAMLWDRNRVAWRWWLLGAFLASLTFIPWLNYLATELAAQTVSSRKWGNLFTFQFWTRWITEPFGISLHYTFEDDFGLFLAGPTVAGRSTYGVGLLHLVMLLCGIAILQKAIRSGWANRANWKAIFSPTSPTQFTIMAGFFGYGLVITATELPITRHYLLLAFPLPCIWLASIAQGSRRWLAGLIASQALISVAFLNGIHTADRPIRGDYGTPYRLQVTPDDSKPPPEMP